MSSVMQAVIAAVTRKAIAVKASHHILGGLFARLAYFKLNLSQSARPVHFRKIGTYPFCPKIAS